MNEFLAGVSGTGNLLPGADSDKRHPVIVLVTGSRDYTNKEKIRIAIIDSQATVIIEGGQRGADRLAREIAVEIGIPYRTYRAKWDQHGKRAGPIRNQEMLDQEPDIALVLAFPLPQSVGTLDMIQRAADKGIRVRIFS